MGLLARARRKLGIKLTVLFLILSLVPLVFLSYLALRSSRQTVEEQQFARLGALAMLKADEVDRWAQEKEQTLTTLAQRGLQPGLVGTLVQGTPGTSIYRATHTSVLENRLLPAAADGGFETLLLLSALDGRVLVSTNGEDENAQREGEPYFVEGRRQTYVQNVYDSPEVGKPVITISTPVRDHNGAVIAVLAGHIDLAGLAEIVGRTNDLIEAERTYVLTPSHVLIGDFIADGEQPWQAARSSGLARCVQGESGQGIYESSGGDMVLGSFRWLPERELCTVAEVEQSVAFEPMDALYKSVFGVGSVATLIIIAAGVLVTRSITRPLKQLVHGTERIGRGDLAYQIPGQRKDEIGQLTDAFNRMTENLRDSRGEAAYGRHLLLALSEAAQAVQRAGTPEEVYRTIGKEVDKLGLNSAILLLSGDGASLADGTPVLRIGYLGFDLNLIDIAEKVVGISHETYRFTVPEGGIYKQVLEEGKTIFLQPVSAFIAESLPGAVQGLAKQVATLLSMREGIVAPLSVDGQAFGVLIVTGSGLIEDDVTAVKAFANQAAIAVQRAQLYERVREDGARFRQLADAMPQLVWTALADGTTTYFNERRQELDGLRQVDGAWQWTEVMHPDDVSATVEAWQEALARSEPFQFEHRIRHQNEAYHWYLSRAVPVRNEQGEVVRWYGTSTDIQPQKEVEETLRRYREDLEELVAERTAELQQSEARFRALFEAAPMSLIVSRREDSVVLEANDKAGETLGMGTASIVGTRATTFYHDPEVRGEFMRELEESGAVYNFELASKHADGGTVWLLTSAIPIDYDGERALLSSFIDVTERKKIEQALRHSEERFRSLVQNGSDVITIVDADGFITYDSPAIERVLGYQPDERVGENVLTLGGFENPEVVETVFSELLRQPAHTLSLELRMRHKQGDWRVLEVTAANLLDNPAVEGIVANFHDVTERVRAQEELRDREALWRSFFTNSPIGIAIIDREHRFQEVNRRLCDIVGHTEKELNTRSFKDITHEGDLEEELALAEQLMRGDIPRYSIEKRYVRKEGKTVWVQVTKSVVRHNVTLSTGEDTGQVAYTIAMIEDIQERREMEQARRRNEALLREVLAHLPVGVWITDAQGKIVQANRAAEAIWAGTKHVSAGEDGEHKGWWLDSGEEFTPQERALTRAIEKGEETINEEVRIESFDGKQKVILNSAIPLWEDVAPLTRDAAPLTKGSAISGAVVVNHDITRMKEAQAQLEAYARDLARSNEELQQFAYVASHDLQEPLRMVTSFLQLLQKRYEGQLDERADQYIFYAVDGATRMKQLITDLLHYSRVATQAQELAPTDSEKILEQVLGDLRITIEESGAIVTSDDLPVVMGDDRQLRQLFQNLIGNAIKFRGEVAPRIHIGVEAVGAGVEEDAGKPGDMWQFAVKDNGIGIEPRFAERIFAIFQRLNRDEKYGGTGIGLAVCRRIVKQHGGDIWVESELGEGATFYFTLRAVSTGSAAALTGGAVVLTEEEKEDEPYTC